MPELSNAQRALLAPQGGEHPRDGAIVPTSNNAPFVNAACWGWALTGEYEHADNAYTAVTIYNSPQGAFRYNDQQEPIGLNPYFFATTDQIFEQTVPYHQTLAEHIDAALAGVQASQDACRVALLKLTACVNGHTVLDDDGSDVYTLVMKTSSWHGWDHWALGIRGPGGGDITYQQKVNGTPLSYNCGVVWDEHQPLETVIRLDGLLQPQVDMLNRVI
ncbi:hypothetical protein ACS5PK_11115 [Roseateles sp. DB2]|uniref:hypothetical protein n=1 Tax=Roseateles sp. DB2 TaxID=3453717 RepID=UPI003EEC5FBB